MNARQKILRDNGLLCLATAVALAGSTGAAAAKPRHHAELVKPNPHNFIHPPAGAVRPLG